MQIKSILSCLYHHASQTASLCYEILSIPYHLVQPYFENSPPAFSASVSHRLSVYQTDFSCFSSLCIKITNFFTELFPLYEQQVPENEKTIQIEAIETRSTSKAQQSDGSPGTAPSHQNNGLIRDNFLTSDQSEDNPRPFYPSDLQIPNDLNSRNITNNSSSCSLTSSLSEDSITPKQGFIPDIEEEKTSDSAYESLISSCSSDLDNHITKEDSSVSLSSSVSGPLANPRLAWVSDAEESDAEEYDSRNTPAELGDENFDAKFYQGFVSKRLFPEESNDKTIESETLPTLLSIYQEKFSINKPENLVISKKLSVFTQEQQCRILSLICLTQKYGNIFDSDTFVDEFMQSRSNPQLKQLLSVRLGKTANLEEICEHLSYLKNCLSSCLGRLNFLYTAGFLVNEKLFGIILPNETKRESVQRSISSLLEDLSVQAIQNNETIQAFFAMVFEISLLDGIDPEQHLDVYGSYIQFSSTLPPDWKLSLFSILTKMSGERLTTAQAAAPVLDSLNQLFVQSGQRESLDQIRKFASPSKWKSDATITNIVLSQLEQIDSSTRSVIAEEIKKSVDGLINELDNCSDYGTALAIIRQNTPSLSDLLEDLPTVELMLLNLFTT